jgi:hypothetical protein
MVICSHSIICPACRLGSPTHFCRLASGGSFAVRQLYTNDEEVLFKAARPILLNGIEDVIARNTDINRALGGIKLRAGFE